jgi:S1-C subfamily serine protease
MAKFALLALGVTGLARAENGRHPLDYHAMVANGRVVGSAFMIDDGVAVTNRHVVTGLRPGGAVVLIASGGKRTRAEGRLIAVSSRMDLAVLAVPRGFLPRLSEDAPPAVGQQVAAAGIDAADGPPPGTLIELTGVVVDAGRTIPAFGPGLVARLPGARPGVSGGPLLDRRGRLVGMVTAIRPGPTGAAGPASGFSPARHSPAAVEAFVLTARDLRAEARRLLAGGH